MHAQVHFNKFFALFTAKKKGQPVNVNIHSLMTHKEI